MSGYDYNFILNIPSPNYIISQTKDCPKDKIVVPFFEMSLESKLERLNHSYHIKRKTWSGNSTLCQSGQQTECVPANISGLSYDASQ